MSGLVHKKEEIPEVKQNRSCARVVRKKSTGTVVVLFLLCLGLAWLFWDAKRQVDFKYQQEQEENTRRQLEAQKQREEEQMQYEAQCHACESRLLDIPGQTGAQCLGKETVRHPLKAAYCLYVCMYSRHLVGDRKA
jgi:hypothetical protein